MLACFDQHALSSCHVSYAADVATRGWRLDNLMI